MVIALTSQGCLKKDHFYRKISNGEKEERTWQIFSETFTLIYCYPCKMFSASKSKLITGFQNWKHIGITLFEHEMSNDTSLQCVHHTSVPLC